MTKPVRQIQVFDTYVMNRLKCHKRNEEAPPYNTIEHVNTVERDGERKKLLKQIE